MLINSRDRRIVAPLTLESGTIFFAITSGRANVKFWIFKKSSKVPGTVASGAPHAVKGAVRMGSVDDGLNGIAKGQLLIVLCAERQSTDDALWAFDQVLTVPGTTRRYCPPGKSPCTLFQAVRNIP